MKIKTITCHEVYNHGASLQTYALQTYLESLGHDVEIIDYKPPYLSKHYDLWLVGNPFYYKYIILRIIYVLLKLPNRLISLKRKRSFDVFAKKYLKISTHRYKSNEELKANCPEGDVFIAGSDQIWNCLFPNGRDPAFYLDFVPKEKVRASYAASFAGSTLDKEYHNMVKERVSFLNYVSVRESSGLEILKQIGINNAKQVLDPVFLLDKTYWNALATEYYNDEYLFVYDFEGSEQIKKICLKIAKEHKLKIFSINCTSSYIDKKFSYSGPETFLSLIKYSKYVVSNSFHGTAFALIFEKEFVVVERSEGINARMIDLLKNLNIQERLITTYQPLQAINYSQVNIQIDNLVQKSKKYLNSVLTKREISK
ncbi:polysaccharide pyruvyl transferase family protein [Ancylomarina sp. 16SWW S1-10-2]|uniref:polysaccharide pyruvyl transferase family protein n=1 Tax=Ancylomarina sp. 16SWW S1-10-2 TaxID=2499681 RepID=UPI0012ADA4D2|nr:polysaccharide pyruvyl transferase family protein [Ancylomarina sp. 16SWW S1-10-2]MRT93433.1 polysaccharide pyruvyl transferase family protein [Ancylomarina sp. 16SWW S1-10-2]